MEQHADNWDGFFTNQNVVCKVCGFPPHIEEIHLEHSLSDLLNDSEKVLSDAHLLADGISSSLVLASKVLASSSLEEAMKHAEEVHKEWGAFLTKIER
ncbi:MAG TPA: hypothetical protein VIY47_08185 [Ignavibacteriaceae bacterium]